MNLTAQQIDFFETFGFIKFPGLLKEEIAWITEEFESVFPMFKLKHDGSKRTMVVPFIDQRERLSSLLDHPAIQGIGASLIGEDFNYMGSDGNYYTGDTPWHPDNLSKQTKYIKVAFYLDRLDGSNGALRVIPGSHRMDDRFAADVIAKAGKSDAAWGIPGSEVPALALDVEPGDILVFNQRTVHSSWGGRSNRRMFTMNLCARYPENDVAELKEQIIMHSHYKRDHYYGNAMLESGNAERRKHLEQVCGVSGDYQDRTRDLPVLERA